MSDIDPKIERILSEFYGPIEATFTPTQVPEGAAPDEIKEYWVGVPLPVRRVNLDDLRTSPDVYYDILCGNLRKNPSPVRVAGQDAVHALYTAERHTASDFWVPYQLGLFVFRAYEGNLQLI